MLYVSSQWESTLHCNVVIHRLGAHTKRSLQTVCARHWCFCCVYIVRCRYNTVHYVKNSHDRRASYGVSFVSANCALGKAWITAMLCGIRHYIERRYTGSRLYYEFPVGNSSVNYKKTRVYIYMGCTEHIRLMIRELFCLFSSKVVGRFWVIINVNSM